MEKPGVATRKRVYLKTKWAQNCSCSSDLQNNRSSGDLIYLCFSWKLLISGWKKTRHLEPCAPPRWGHLSWRLRRAKEAAFDSRRKFRTQPAFFTWHGSVDLVIMVIMNHNYKKDNAHGVLLLDNTPNCLLITVVSHVWFMILNIYEHLELFFSAVQCHTGWQVTDFRLLMGMDTRLISIRINIKIQRARHMNNPMANTPHVIIKWHLISCLDGTTHGSSSQWLRCSSGPTGGAGQGVGPHHHQLESYQGQGHMVHPTTLLPSALHDTVCVCVCLHDTERGGKVLPLCFNLAKNSQTVK